MKRWPLRILVCLFLGVVTTVGVAWGFALTIDWSSSSVGIGQIDHTSVAWIVSTYRTLGGRRFHSIPVFGQDLARAREHDDAESLDVTVAEPVTISRIPRWSRVRIEFDPDRYIWSAQDVADEDSLGWPRASMRCTTFANSIGFRNRMKDDEAFHVEPDRIWWIANDGERYDLELEPGDGVRNGILIDVTFDPVGRVQDFRVLPLRPIWPGFVLDTLLYGAIWFGLFLGFGAARRSMRTRRGRCPQCGYDLRGDLEAGCPECGWGRD